MTRSLTRILIRKSDQYLCSSELPRISNTMSRFYQTFRLMVWVNTVNDLILIVCRFDRYCMVQWFCLIILSLFNLFVLMVWADTVGDIILSLGQCDIYFIVQWLCVRFLTIFMDLHYPFRRLVGQGDLYIYSRTLVARTLMARLPRLFRTRSCALWNKFHSCKFGIWDNLGWFSFLYWKLVYCLYSLESPHWGDFNENTQYTLMLKK